MDKDGIRYFEEHYSGMSDDELVMLFLNRWNLTEEARYALGAEFLKRKLDKRMYIGRVPLPKPSSGARVTGIFRRVLAILVLGFFVALVSNEIRLGLLVAGAGLAIYIAIAIWNRPGKGRHQTPTGEQSQEVALLRDLDQERLQ